MKQLILPFILFFSAKSFSQGYEIKINFKNAPDSIVYLAKYVLDKQYVVDTCKKVKNGTIIFKGKASLDKGVYFLVSEGKAKYFDFFVNEDSKFTITSDVMDMVNSFKCVGSKENELAFGYLKFMTNINREFGKVAEKTKGMAKADSVKLVSEKTKSLHEEVVKFNADFRKTNEGSFFAAFLNLQTEKTAVDVPKSKNGRPDSIFYSNYYRAHFWDGVNFADEKIYRTPFFSDRFKRYFDQCVYMIPDTVIKELDKILIQCKTDVEVTKAFLAQITFDYETKSSKFVGFDKVFVHLIDRYIRAGWLKGYYTDETIEKIKDRGDILKPLLLGSVAPDLLMMDTINGKIANKMGFDSANTSAAVSHLYYKNLDKINTLYTTLHQLKAKYTILVFWDVECSHCLTEIPKLLQTWHELRKTYDIKVFSVYSQHEFDKWRKFIIEKKYDFINVFDAVHINNIKQKYDIFSTPKIYILDKNKTIRSKGIAQEQIPEIIKMMEADDKK